MNFDFRQKPLKIKTALFAVVLGLLAGSVLILFTGNDPLAIYGYMLKGALGSPSAIASTMRWATPLLYAGLAAAIAFRGGMFNFGVEGQLYMGALASALAGIYITGLPKVLHILVCMLAAMAAGLVWALLPAFIRVKLGGNEAIPAMMLNYVAMNLCDFLVQRFFLPESTFGQTMVAVGHFFLRYTKPGYNISMTGLNAEFAQYGGVNVRAVRVQVMLLSGAVAGLCGAVEVLGVTWRYESGFSPDFGIEGILASLLGGNEPFGLLVAALFMGAVKAGSLVVERSAGIPRALAEVIKALIICFVSARLLAEYLGLDRLEKNILQRLKGPVPKSRKKVKEE